MNGILAQTAALTAHAKARVFDSQLGGDDVYWAAHSTFKYVKTLTFVTQKRSLFRSGEQEIATTPCGWMATLPRTSVISLISFAASGRLPARLASAFVGGTRDGIGVSSNDSSGIWVPTWELSGDKYPEQRIWRVRYTMAQAPPVAPLPTTVEQARERLGKSLRAAADFAAADPALFLWCDTFRKAEDTLGDPKPTAPYHPDILPPAGYTLAAQQLLAAAVGGFVFGGMGSWNDSAPESADARPQYERLSEELYAAVTGGLVVAINGGMAA